MQNEQHELTQQFADKIAGFAAKAEQFMTAPAIWTSLIAGAIAYAKVKGTSDETIIAELRGVADALEQTTPPAPTIN